jgi:hypothetical protein
MSTFYVTKYALTAGILKVKGKLFADGTAITYRRNGASWMDEYAHGKDFHTTLSAATERADEMREKKILSLEKTVLKHKKATTFKVVDCT